ncbi:hypothetical protein JNO54_04370 [Janibacter sp. YIM B02568]|uniref:hypothetical protein n=1 Tax=Janibacter endophyticus TaxID=2806261 RepID=UPI00194F1E96|nr:hypothetical protein [Janibacter endophyticus]MBM6545376.1 hypothetical protein [Janibacter endophyticus]
MSPDDGTAEPSPRRRRHRRASHPGTSEAARAASTQAEDTPSPRTPRSEGTPVLDPREKWLLDERPPHWGRD